MTDGQTMTMALMALCGADLALIWQVSKLADRVHGLNEDMHSTMEWLARMEAHRLHVARMKEDGGNDDEE